MGRGRAGVGSGRIRHGQVWAGVGQVWADMGRGRIRCGQVSAGVGQMWADMGRARIRCGQVWAGVGQVWADVGKGRIRCGQVWAGVGLALKLQVEMSGAGPGEASSRVCAAALVLSLGEEDLPSQRGQSHPLRDTSPDKSRFSGTQNLEHGQGGS